MVGLKFLVEARTCDGAYCQVIVNHTPQRRAHGDYTGFVPQESLWGVYSDEQFDWASVVDAIGLLHPDDHIDMADHHALGGIGQARNLDCIGGDIDDPLLVFDKEVMMVGRVGIEIGPGRVHGNLAQQTGLAELVQRIVDGGQRHLNARSPSPCNCSALT